MSAVDSVERIAAKVFLDEKSHLPLERVIPVFHRWIQKDRLAEMLIDVADYTHVPQGPGVMLISHEGIYSCDQGNGRTGLRYLRRREGSGTFSEKISRVLCQLHAAANALSEEKDLSSVRFSFNDLQIEVQDRLHALPSDENIADFRAKLEPVLSPLTKGRMTIEPGASDPRAGLVLRAVCDKPFELSRLA